MRAPDGFNWIDGERTIRFGRGAATRSDDLLGEGYALLTTDRARGDAPAVAERAQAVHIVGPGRVDELAAALLPGVTAERLVALGGGRVIDTAKAIGAATGAVVAAVPTTLSAAEMTRIHRLPTGFDFATTPLIRPKIVINDPLLCASQPPAELAASAANALAHAIEGRVTTLTSPVPALIGEEAARLIDVAFFGDDPEDVHRDQLALAAMLSGYVIDSTRYGLHHVMSQTLVREAGAGHGQANAVLLPHTLAALEGRMPGHVDADGTLRELARKLATRAGAERIRDLGVEEDSLQVCADAASARAELHLTPPPADTEELLSIYRSAW